MTSGHNIVTSFDMAGVFTYDKTRVMDSTGQSTERFMLRFFVDTLKVGYQNYDKISMYVTIMKV